MSRGWAAAAAMPVPFWALVPALARPEDPLVRYHALQSGVWTLLGVLILTLTGLAGRGPVTDLLAAIVAVVTLGGLAGAALEALRGRHPRLRPAWDLLAMWLRADGSARDTAPRARRVPPRQRA